MFILSILCFVLAGCSSKDSGITEDVIKNSATDDMRSFSYRDFAQQPEVHLLNVDKVVIESQEQGEGGQIVYANLMMSDETLSVSAFYKLLYRKAEQNWRLDQATSYKAAEITMSVKPTEANIRSYYQEKYGSLELSKQKESNGMLVYRYTYEDIHTYLTARGELEITVEPFYSGREAGWTTFKEEETGKQITWNVEGQWCYYFSCKPETYGKSDFFSDSRYVYTISKENDQFVYTIDRYKCEPGEQEKLDKSTRGVAKISEGKNPSLECYNDYTFTTLSFTKDQVSQIGLGVNDKIYKVE